MITVDISEEALLADGPLEIVERKGKGHPDSICDAVMDAVSVALCREYLAAFGTILHHNVDKGLLAAGAAAIRFGGGEVLRPMELFIGDRVTSAAAGRTLPVREIAVEAAETWFRENLPWVDPGRDLICRPLFSPGSEELAGIFARPGDVLPANDTSAAVGWWPLSPTEQAVLSLEKFLNGSTFKGRFPETGQDVKVMALRRDEELSVTVAMGLRSTLIPTEGEYFACKEAITREIVRFLEPYPFAAPEVVVNALDEPGKGEAGVYLTLLGTSAENADSGQVGRGNRVNGLIPLLRPLGSEAAAGKNPVSHVGKIYNFLAHLAARRICEEIPGVREATVFLLSRIGSPIDTPRLAALRITPDPEAGRHEITRRAREVMERELAVLPLLCIDLATGKYPVC